VVASTVEIVVLLASAGVDVEVESVVVVMVAAAAAEPAQATRTSTKMPAANSSRRVTTLLALCLRIVAGMVGYLVVQVNVVRHVSPVSSRRMDMDQPNVFVYALSTCGHCRAAKKLLTDNGVKFEFVDVDLLPRDELRKVLAEVAKVNPGQSFPTILIGDQVIVGNREQEILETLGL
jgi:glutaredoxin